MDERPNGAPAAEKEPDLLRDPADLSPAERTRELVAAVARDDLLAVVLVLQNCYPEEVVASDEQSGQTAFDAALQTPTTRDDVRRLVTQCLLVSEPPESVPVNLDLGTAQVGAARKVLEEWQSGEDPQVQDATQLYFELMMGEVEAWIREHGLELNGSIPALPSAADPDAGPAIQAQQASPLIAEEKPVPATTEAAPAAPVKREPSTYSSTSPVPIKHEPSPITTRDALAVQVPRPSPPRSPAAAASPISRSASIAASVASPLTHPPRIMVRHLPLRINPVSLRDLIGPATRHITLDISLAENEVTAVVEVTSPDAAREAVERLQGFVYDDGKEERTLQVELRAGPATLEPLRSSARDSALPPSCPSSPKDSKPGFLASATPISPALPQNPPRSTPPRQHYSPPRKDALERRRSLSPRRRESLPTRPSFSPPRPDQRSSSPARHSRDSPSRRTSQRVQWLYVTAVSPELSERALADILAREEVEAYDIRVQHPLFRSNAREERTATIGLYSEQDVRRASLALRAAPMGSYNMYVKSYRDPATGATEPPPDSQCRYVNHRYNLSHPPYRGCCTVVISGLHRVWSSPADVGDLVEAACGPRSVLSVEIAGNGRQKSFSRTAYVELDRQVTAIRAIEQLDGAVEHGYATTVNWDEGPSPSRHPHSPPSRRSQTGFSAQPFRRYGDP
ncbi:hypothetical protein JCM10908_001204 [Rhodotorula pacifica]|uniref:RNA-binding family protein n=1 Tax=Rhodotorula pacifica TaxID=1495444 RepID=UPI0031780705